jgi:hypothetical protein
MTYLAFHDESKGKDYLRRALTINPHFHILYAEIAERTLRNSQHDAQ